MLLPRKYALAAAAVAMAVVLPANLTFAQGMPKPNKFWWPEQVDLSPLRAHSIESNPLGADFNYAAEFATLDLNAVKKDIEAVMKTSQDLSLIHI